MDANSLAQCRLVSKPFKEIIDSDRQWLIVQINQIHQKEERIPLINARISIESLFPFWTSFIQKLSKNAILPILSDVVAELWILDESLSYNANPFHKAIALNKIGFVKTIIDCGFNLEISDPTGLSPMHIACRSGSLEMVQMLIDSIPTFDSSDLTDDRSTIFHFAVQNPDIEVTKIIFEKYSFTFNDVTNDTGITVLHNAVAFGPKNTIIFLLDKYLQVNQQCLEARTDVGDTLLHLACNFRDIQVVNIVYNTLFFSESNIDFDTQNDFGYMPLHLTFSNELSDTLAEQVLRMYPETIHIVDEDNLHMLHWACALGDINLVKCISEFISEFFEIDFNVTDNDGNTPLHHACMNSQVQIVQYLTQIADEKSIDINMMNNDQMTPADLALEEEEIQMILGQ